MRLSPLRLANTWYRKAVGLQKSTTNSLILAGVLHRFLVSLAGMTVPQKRQNSHVGQQGEGVDSPVSSSLTDVTPLSEGPTESDEQSFLGELSASWDSK